LRLDSPGLRLQHPVAAQSSEAGGVRARGDVGASQLTQQRGRLLPIVAFGEIASINKNVGLIRQGFPDRGQFVGILSGHGFGGERAGTQLQLPRATMRDEVDGIYAAASGQRLSNLLNPISCGIKHDHFCIGADPG